MIFFWEEVDLRRKTAAGGDMFSCSGSLEKTWSGNELMLEQKKAET
jgi:hypothetical protein